MIDYTNQDFIPQPEQDKIQLTVFYINDTHGDINRVTRLKSAHDKFRKKNKKQNSLTLGAGDLYLGSNEDRNSLMTGIYNSIGLDYNTLGNHEYDAGSEELSDLLKKAKFKTVATNIKFPSKNELSKRLKDKKLVKSDICMKNGTRFGILGVSPSDKEVDINSDNKVSVLSLDDTIKILNEEAGKLEEQGVDKIILLSHTGYGENGDLKIAEQTQGIDIIIGGHTHTELNGVKKSGDKTNLVHSKRCEPVIITQAGSNNTNVGYLDVLFDKKGVIEEDKINNTLVNLSKYKKSKKTERILKKSLGKNEVIAKVTVPFIPSSEDDERKAENPVAEILADGMLNRGRYYGTEVAFFNSPSMKSSEIKDEITSYDIKFRMLPYDDDVVNAPLTEKQFIELLDAEAKTIITKDNSQILQCAGMKYTINKEKAKKGEICVENVCILDENGNVSRIVDVKNPDSKKMINCAMTKFLFADSRLKDITKDIPEDKTTYIGNQQEIFINQIKLNGELKAVKAGRLIIK